VKKLLDEYRHYYLGLVQNKTSIFKHHNNKWKPSKPKNKR